MGALLTVVVWGAVQATRPPEMSVVEISPADGFRAQQKLFEIMRRARSGRAHTVELSEREVNAFLARHLGGAADMPVNELSTRLHGDGRAMIAGRISWKDVLDVPPLPLVSSVLPADWLAQKAWLSLLARVEIERSERPRERRYLRLDVETFRLGRLRLPEIMVRVLLDPSVLRLLRTPLPDGIEAIRVEDGRLFIGTSP
jgi:hypothetical protein